MLKENKKYEAAVIIINVFVKLVKKKNILIILYLTHQRSHHVHNYVMNKIQLLINLYIAMQNFLV